MKKIKRIFYLLNQKLLYGKYNETYEYINKKSNLKDYFLKFISTFIIVYIFMILVFPNLLFCIMLSAIITIFFINEILLNQKKIEYENYLLSQLTIYTSQMAMLINFNNIYASLKSVVKFIGNPLKSDIEKVINKINNGLSINESFLEFNRKYNNRTITLFNQTLELFDEHGDSDSSNVLHIISEEMNNLKIKKDKFLKFKKEWRINFYVVVFLCMSMPIILKQMIPSIYIDFMHSFGTIVMSFIVVINLIIIKKIETLYRNQSIGEGGY